MKSILTNQTKKVIRNAYVQSIEVWFFCLNHIEWVYSFIIRHVFHQVYLKFIEANIGIFDNILGTIHVFCFVRIF